MHRFVPCFFIILILTVDQSTWDAHFAWIDYIILVSWSVKQIKTRETMECFCSSSYWVCFFLTPKQTIPSFNIIEYDN
jgi:hypothetical protein